MFYGRCFVPSFCVNTHLPVSHVTAIDVIDHEIATRISLGNPSRPLYGVGVPNDATNACVSLDCKYATLF